jgi:cullin 3
MRKCKASVIVVVQCQVVYLMGVTLDLNRMYRMLSYVEQGHNTMRKAMNNYIRICGRDINQTVIEEEKERAVLAAEAAAADEVIDKKEQKKTGNKERSVRLAIRWVELALILQDKFNRILNEAFGGDKSFQICISEVSSMVYYVEIIC